MLSENHLLELIPGYALDCLSEQDMLLVSEHLSQCSSCRVELDSYLRIVNDLYLAVPEVAPPPDLNKRCLVTSRKNELGLQRSNPFLPGSGFGVCSGPPRQFGLMPAWF